MGKKNKYNGTNDKNINDRPTYNNFSIRQLK